MCAGCPRLASQSYRNGRFSTTPPETSSEPPPALRTALTLGTRTVSGSCKLVGGLVLPALAEFKPVGGEVIGSCQLEYPFLWYRVSILGLGHGGTIHTKCRCQRLLCCYVSRLHDAGIESVEIGSHTTSLFTFINTERKRTQVPYREATVSPEEASAAGLVSCAPESRAGGLVWSAAECGMGGLTCTRMSRSVRGADSRRHMFWLPRQSAWRFCMRKRDNPLRGVRLVFFESEQAIGSHRIADKFPVQASPRQAPACPIM